MSEDNRQNAVAEKAHSDSEAKSSKRRPHSSRQRDSGTRRTAIKALEAIGAVGLFAAGILVFKSHPYVAISCLFIALTSFVLAIYLTWLPALKATAKRKRVRIQRIFSIIQSLVVLLCASMAIWLWHSDQQAPKSNQDTPLVSAPTPLRGILLPASDPDPPINCGKPSAKETVFYLGASAASSTMPSATILRMDCQDIISFERTSDGIYINAIVYDANDREVARIARNVIRVEPVSGYYARQIDDHTLIVLTPDDKRALYVRYMNPYSIKILGLFFRHGFPILVDEKTSVRSANICFQMNNAGVLFDVSN